MPTTTVLVSFLDAARDVGAPWRHGDLGGLPAFSSRSYLRRSEAAAAAPERVRASTVPARPIGDVRVDLGFAPRLF
jgi:hypothetical protein